MKLSLTNGTGDSKSDRIWMKSATAAGASDTYDLDGGSDCVDAFGNGISFSKVRVLYIRNKSETTGEKLIISGDWFSTAVLGGTTPTLDIQPKGCLLLPALVDGYAITAVSADQLTINPGANTVSYDVIIIGED